MTEQIRFNDGTAYAKFMGAWSQPAGDVFLDWLDVPAGARWLDVGCGNGAFTTRICARCAPVSVTGIDPSPAQLDYAREQHELRDVEFHLGSAMALPFGDGTFGAAVMPLVIPFVPEPAVGVGEMVRVVRAGGSVAAYIWDMDGNGFPYESLHDAIRARGFVVPTPPHPEVSSLDALAALWRDAGLQQVETRVIPVQRTFSDFDEYWSTVLGGASVAALLGGMPAEERGTIRQAMQQKLPADAGGRITLSAVANAVRGRVPGVGGADA